MRVIMEKLYYRKVPGFFIYVVDKHYNYSLFKEYPGILSLLEDSARRNIATDLRYPLGIEMFATLKNLCDTLGISLIMVDV
tara:strand:- start:661 stop:903 length:243 start_codon:yes stop_codon:yes gene_type:complete